MSRASGLFRLQQVDMAIDQARSRLAAIETELAEGEALQQARRALEESKRVRDEASGSARSAESAVESQRLKMAETDQKLYGGAIQNPKELQELQQESESLRRHLSTLEDRLLEEMVAVEQAEEGMDQRQADLEIAEADHLGRNQNLVKERQSVTSDLERRVVEREAATAGVTAEDMTLYSRLRGSLGGLAVVQLREDSCGACGLTLGSSDRQEVRSGSSLLRCKQCGRILYAG